MRKSVIAPIIATVVASLWITAAAQASVIIQEVLYDGPGTDADDVFTELSGPPGMALAGWSLVGINGGDGLVYQSIDLSGLVIPGDGIVVIATSSANSTLALQRDLIANVDWQNGPDALQILYGGTIMDALQYGDAGMFNAGEGGFAADVSGAISLSRDIFGTDTNDNAVDFTAGDPSPGSRLPAVPVPAAAWLFASALGLLGGTRRRHSR